MVRSPPVGGWVSWQLPGEGYGLSGRLSLCLSLVETLRLDTSGGGDTARPSSGGGAVRVGGHPALQRRLGAVL